MGCLALEVVGSRVLAGLGAVDLLLRALMRILFIFSKRQLVAELVDANSFSFF